MLQLHTNTSPPAAGTIEAISLIVLMTLTIAPAAAEEAPPPPTTQPAGELTILNASQSPIARIRVDPRGISQLRLAAEPQLDWVIPGRDHAWHYREWQWWRGHPWGDTMRPRYWAGPRLELDRLKQGCAAIAYQADGFRGLQQFFFPPAVDRGDDLHFDLVTTVANESGGDVDAYGQFFACYTPVNRRQSSFYWGTAGLVRWADRGVEHLNGYAANPSAWFHSEGHIPHCPRGDGRIVDTWRHPVLVSHASPKGWRSVILVEEQRCAALAQGMEGNAMDYILYPDPSERRFARDQSFSAHIRHCLVRLPELPDTGWLERAWTAFEASHAGIHDRARRLRR